MGRGILGMNGWLCLVHQQDLLTVGTDQADPITQRGGLQVGGVKWGMAERADDADHVGLL